MAQTTSPDQGPPEALFRDLFEHAPDAMVIVDSEGVIRFANAQAAALFGYEQPELVGHEVEQLVPDRLRDRHRSERAGYAADPRARMMETGLELFGLRKDGTEFPAEISLSPLHTDQGLLVCGAIRNIAARRLSEQEASHSRSVIDSSRDAIICIDLDGMIISWNRSAERLYGYPSSEALGKPVAMLVPEGNDEEIPDVIARVVAGEEIDHYETVRLRKDGEPVFVSLTVSGITDSDGSLIGVSSMARDIGDRLRYLEQLREYADHDALTGLRNRVRFAADLSDQVGRAQRYGEFATLMLIDLDGLGEVNGTYGHRTGDRALKTIGAALKWRLRETDVVARIGGDEFAVLMPYLGADDAAAIAEDLRGVVNDCRIEVDGGASIRLTASIGHLQIDDGTQDDESVLGEADRLMKQAKEGPSA